MCIHKEEISMKNLANDNKMYKSLRAIQSRKHFSRDSGKAMREKSWRRRRHKKAGDKKKKLWLYNNPLSSRFPSLCNLTYTLQSHIPLSLFQMYVKVSFSVCVIYTSFPNFCELCQRWLRESHTRICFSIMVD